MSSRDLTSAPQAVPRPPSAEKGPEVGQWYWKREESGMTGSPEWLGCITHVGTNYVRLQGPHYHARVHLDEFGEVCRLETRAKEIIAQKIDEQRQVISQSTQLIAALASRLQLEQESAGTKEIAAYQGGAVATYKADLIGARDAGLPALKAKIEQASEVMRDWMKAEAIPIEATMRECYETAIEKVKKRIAGVELYAGLVEESVKIRDGAPAPPDTPVHLFQRRLYMDEECLANYQVGGMTFDDLESFEAWLLEAENLARVMPMPRSAVAFRVRRERKEHDSVLEMFVKVGFGGFDKDMLTYLYMRNGEQVWRLSASIDFGEKLFPDLEHQLVTGEKIYAVMFGGEVERLATEGEYLDLVWRQKQCAAEIEALPDDDNRTQAAWAIERKYGHPRDENRYTLWDKSNVYYDDITCHVRGEMEQHNRLVLLLQGLFDRSEVFHPHPPFKLWDATDFGRALTLVYDDSRTLVAGERPDFASYQAKVNESLRPGSLAVGQEEAWLEREVRRYNKNLERTMRYPERQYAMRKRYRPEGDPGPGVIAEVKGMRDGLCTFAWSRPPSRENPWRPSGKVVTDKLVVPASNLLCVDGYKPGDYKLFYADPRTRAEYLRWAPLLLRAEEWHAGRTQLKNDS